MSAHRKLDVGLDNRSYPILIGQGLLKNADWLEKSQRKAFIIADETVADLYGEQFLTTIKSSFSRVEFLKVPAGEKSKSFSQYQEVIEWLLENKATRDSVLIVLGGGVIGDLGGFAAATVLRGIDFIQIPTTLLAQVDSSVGGKTGINSRFGKNLVGSFYQPQKVIIDTDVLNTLPPREMKAGYAEVFKYALLGSAKFYSWLMQNGANVLAKDPETLLHAIEISCAMKADIVEQDEKETTGFRALLNLGHTFAHAIEAAAQYDGRVLHGEAVGIGLNLAAQLSAKLGHISQQDAVSIAQHMRDLDMMTEIRDIQPGLPVTAEDLYQLMQQDKKAGAHGLTFVVLNEIGAAELQSNIDESIVLDILRGSL